MGILVEHVDKSFGEPPVGVLHDISFAMKDGEFVSLTGKSGSGKSTLLYIVSSLDRPSSGKVELHGQDVATMSEKEIHLFRNHHVGFVFQFHHLLPELTALDNVLLPARKANQHKNPERESYARSLMEEFEIDNKMKSLPGQLSGGERQRVALARALVMEPDFLFADEPTGNLDSTNGEIVMNLFQRINREKGTSIIMVTHDADFASLARRQIMLVDGRIVKDE